MFKVDTNTQFYIRLANKKSYQCRGMQPKPPDGGSCFIVFTAKNISSIHWLILCYCWIRLNILFGDVFPTKTHVHIRLTNQEWAFNWEVCNQMDGRPYFIVLTAIHNFYHKKVYTVLLSNNNEYIFCIQTWYLSYSYIQLTDEEWSFNAEEIAARMMEDPTLLFFL